MDKGYFSERRSIRHYSDKPVSEELVDSIVARAIKAPTCGTMQLYTVIATRTPEMLTKLAPTHFNQPAATGAKVMLTICADFNRFTRWCKLSDADPGYDNFLSFMNATVDAVVIAQQIVTIAEMEGLGTCYLGTVTYNADKISEILELPELVVPVACVTLGWPAEEGTETERLPLAAVLHKEKYRADSDAEILKLFKAKDDYEPNKKFIEENGKKTLAQVYTDIRYPRAMNESFSETFLKVLKDKKFI